MPQTIDWKSAQVSKDAKEKLVGGIITRALSLDDEKTAELVKTWDSSAIDVCLTINGVEFPCVDVFVTAYELMAQSFDAAVKREANKKFTFGKIIGRIKKAFQSAKDQWNLEAG